MGSMLYVCFAVLKSTQFFIILVCHHADAEPSLHL